MLENIPSDKKKFYDSVCDGISLERIEAYRLEEDVDELDAVARYLWNIALCEALYPCLQSFEVALRNAVHACMARRYGAAWFQAVQPLRRLEQGKVDDAENSLRNQGKPIESGRIVAELTLGFWTGLFVHEYDRAIVIPLMQSGFRKFPTALRNRRTLYERFEDVRYLRNRVFHYEPIWYWKDLPQRHKALIDDIGFINPETGKLASHLDRFTQVHVQGWKQYREWIDKEFLLPPENSTVSTEEPS